MELVKRCINKGSGTYPPELKAFALTLQFYSAQAYEYVQKNIWQKPATSQNRVESVLVCEWQSRVS